MSNLFLLIDPDRQGLRSAELYGVEIHGVKLLFRWKRTHAVEVPHANRSCGEAPVKAREGAREASSRSTRSLPVRTEKPMRLLCRCSSTC